MRAFSTVLMEFLEERDRQNSDYYDDRFFGDRHHGHSNMVDLMNEMDDMFDSLESGIARALLTGKE